MVLNIVFDLTKKKKKRLISRFLNLPDQDYFILFYFFIGKIPNQDD